MSWRDIAAPIIADVLWKVGRQDMKALRKALRDAYPFGQRKMHPYPGLARKAPSFRAGMDSEATITTTPMTAATLPVLRVLALRASKASS